MKYVPHLEMIGRRVVCMTLESEITLCDKIMARKLNLRCIFFFFFYIN